MFWKHPAEATAQGSERDASHRPEGGTVPWKDSPSHHLAAPKWEAAGEATELRTMEHSNKK